MRMGPVGAVAAAVLLAFALLSTPVAADGDSSDAHTARVVALDGHAPTNTSHNTIVFFNSTSATTTVEITISSTVANSEHRLYLDWSNSTTSSESAFPSGDAMPLCTDREGNDPVSTYLIPLTITPLRNGTNVVRIDWPSVNHEYISMSTKYALCATNLTEHETSSSSSDITGSMGFTGLYFAVTYGMMQTNIDNPVSQLYLPHNLASEVTQLTLPTFHVSATWASGSRTADIPFFATGSAGAAYFVREVHDCRRSNAQLALNETITSGRTSINLYTTTSLIDTVLNARATYKLCFAGSDTAAVPVGFVGELYIEDQRLTTTRSQRATVLAGTTERFRLAPVATPAAALSMVAFAPCAALPGSSIPTQLTLAFSPASQELVAVAVDVSSFAGAPTSYAYDIAVCMTGYGVTESIRLSLAINVVWFSQIGGVNAGTNTSAEVALSSWAGENTTAYDVLWNGFLVDSTYFFASARNNCSRDASTTDSNFNSAGTTLIVPGAWLTGATPYLCVAANGDVKATRVSPFVFRVLTVSGVRPLYDVAGMPADADVHLLATDTSPTVVVSGDFQGQPVRVGVVNAAGTHCVQTVALGSTGYGIFSQTALATGQQKFCVTASGGSKLNIASFRLVSIGSFGGRVTSTASTGIPAFTVAAPFQGTPTNFSYGIGDAQPANQRFFTAGIVFENCNTAFEGVQVNAYSSVTTVSVLATTSAAGLQRLCWRLATMPQAMASAVVDLYVFPPSDSTLALSPADGFARLLQPYDVRLRFPPTSAVIAGTRFGVALFRGESCGDSSTQAFANTATLSSTNSSAGVTLRTAAAGSFAVCGGFGSIAYGEGVNRITFSHPIAVLRHFSITFDDGLTIPNGTVTIPFVVFGETPNARVALNPQLQDADRVSMNVVDEAFTCTYAGHDGAPLFSAGDVTAATQGNTFYVSDAMLGVGGTYRLCIRMNDGPWLDSDAKVRIVVVSSIDAVAANGTNTTGRTNQTASNGTNTTNAPPAVPNIPTGISILAGATRAYVINGNDMDAPSGWRLSLYRGNVSTVSDCRATPDASFFASVVTPDNVTFQISFPSPGQFNGMCLSAEAVAGVYQHNVLTTSAVVVPIASFQTQGGTPVTTHLKAVRGVGTRYVLNIAANTTAAALAGLAFVAAPSCGVVDVASDNRILFPFTLGTGTAASYIEVPKVNVTTGTSGWPLCLVDLGTGARRQTNAAARSFDTGMQVTYVSVSLNDIAPGAGENIGHFRGTALTLHLGGAADLASSDEYQLYVFLDDVACGSSTREGTLTSSGLSRAPMLVTSCGTDSATVVVPAASGFTTSPLRICLMLEDRIVDPGLSEPETVVVDTNTTLTILGADSLGFVRPLPTLTSLDRSYSAYPALSLRDLATGTLLSTLPFDLTVEARWYVVDPIQMRILSPTYTVVAVAGSASVDFSTANIANPGVHGYDYVLEFRALNRPDIAGINSSVTRRTKCYAAGTYADIFTEDCLTCPTHATCDGSMTYNVSGSYWRPSNRTPSLHSCGLPYGGSACQDGTETGTCAAGHEGPRCTECVAGWGKAISSCVKCNPGTDWLVVLLVAVFVVLLLLVLVVTTIRCKKSDQLPIYLKVLITHLITASILGGSSLLMPDFLVEYFSVQKAVSRPTPEFAAFDCFFGATFYDKFIVINVAPVAVAICVIFVLLVRALATYCSKDDDNDESNVGSALHKEQTRAVTPRGRHVDVDQAEEMSPEERQMERKKSMALQKVIKKQSAGHFFMVIMIVVLFYGYPSLVEWCINVLRCEDLSYFERRPDGTMAHVEKRVLYFDRNIDCDSAKAQNYFLAGIILMFVWGIGIPLSAVLIFLSMRAKLGRVLASRMFTFVVAGYRSRVWWWETVLMIRKFAIIVIVSFIEDPRLQALISFWVLAIHLIAHMVVCPYEYRTVDRMETASLYVLCGTLNLALLFDWVSVDDADLGIKIAFYALSVIVLVINIGVILWMLWLVLREANNKFKRWIRENRQWCQDSVPCCGNWLVAHGFSVKDEEVIAPALSYGNMKDHDKLDPRKKLADEARHGTVANMMVIEDDSASDWSDDGSDDDDRESVVVAGSGDFHLSPLRRRSNDDGVQWSLREDGDDEMETMESMGNFAAPARLQPAHAPTLQAPPKSAIRRRSAGGTEQSGVFVQVTDEGREAGGYQLGRGADDAQMSGAFTAAELRKAARNGDVLDGVNNVAQSFEVGSSDDDDQNGPGGPPRVNTASPNLVQTESMPVDPSHHDVKQCTNVIRTLRASMAALRERAETLGSDNAELKATVEQLEKNVQMLEKKLSVSQEFTAQMEAQVKEQHRTIDSIREAVSKLEQENAELRGYKDKAESLEGENAQVVEEREALRSQLRDRPKTSDHLAAALDGWREQRDQTKAQRDAQMKILQIEADLRAERIDELERQEREEQQRLVAEHIERKRIARAAKMGRPATDGAATAGDGPRLAALQRQSTAPNGGLLMTSVRSSGSPASAGSRKISFASRARAVGRAARAFTPSNLTTSSQDTAQLARMQNEGVLPETDHAGRPVVIIHRKKAAKLEPSVRRAFSMKR